MGFREPHSLAQWPARSAAWAPAMAGIPRTRRDPWPADEEMQAADLVVDFSVVLSEPVSVSDDGLAYPVLSALLFTAF